MHVGVALVLDPPEGTRSLFSRRPGTRRSAGSSNSASTWCARCANGPCGCRSGCITRARVDDPDFAVDDHLTRASLPAPGRPRGAQRLRRNGDGPPARPRPTAVGDARRRGSRGRPDGAVGQGAPLHPRRGQRSFCPRRLPRPLTPVVCRRAASGVAARAAAVDRPGVARRHAAGVAGPPARRDARDDPGGCRDDGRTRAAQAELSGRGERPPPGFFAGPRTSFNGAVSNRSVSRPFRFPSTTSSWSAASSRRP